jgi:hypothetical protein
MLRSSGLHGYSIPGVAYRAVVQLFVDDTTVYLHEQDHFEDLTKILDRWCLVSGSGARFNSSKTGVIPYGSEAFHEQLLATRHLNPLDEEVPANIHIAKDGEAV